MPRLTVQQNLFTNSMKNKRSKCYWCQYICFCTKSRRRSDKALEQCSYFKFTQITSSDKTEVRNQGAITEIIAAAKPGAVKKKMKKRKKRLSIVPENFQGCLLPGLSA